MKIRLNNKEPLSWLMIMEELLALYPYIRSNNVLIGVDDEGIYLYNFEERDAEALAAAMKKFQ